MGEKSSKMQRTEESEKPELRKRTPKVSIAFATLQESNCCNSFSNAGSNLFELMSSPEHEIAAAFAPITVTICDLKWQPSFKRYLHSDQCSLQRHHCNRWPEQFGATLNFQLESAQGPGPVCGYAEGGARSG